jgi:OmpR-family two-component system manganese-sensing response regulator
MPKILLVEDDVDLANQLQSWFSAEGHLLEMVNNGEDALQMLAHFEFELVILDWNLPGISGLEVCHQYRKSGGKTFIIFLTGKGDIDNKEQALDFGADDYMTKPFDIRELSARMRSIMRRPISLLPTELVIDDVRLDLNTKTVHIKNKAVHLTPKETVLLEFFMRHPNRVYGSKNLLDSVWPSDTEASTQTVRQWVSYLRRKLQAAGKPDLIKTVTGSGYVLEHKSG